VGENHAFLYESSNIFFLPWISSHFTYCPLCKINENIEMTLISQSVQTISDEQTIQGKEKHTDPENRLLQRLFSVNAMKS
jgi:hypothetical protein